MSLFDDHPALPLDESPDSLPPQAIRVGSRYRQDMGDLQPLVESIATIGLLHPIVVTPDCTLVAGARRLAAVTALGWPRVPVRVVNLGDLLRAEHDENVIRKAFTPTEAVAIAAALRPVAEAEARERQREAGRLKGEASGNFPEAGGERAREAVARAVGVSGRTLEKAEAVVAAAEEDPETFGDLPEQMDATGKVHPAYEELQRRRPHVANNTGKVDWYTPPAYLEAARQVMGGIDLDPASCPEANERVQAARYYTAEDDGLTREWAGRVWLNPPYASGLIDRFADKLAAELDAGRVTEAITLTNNATETGWFDTLAARCSAFMHPKGRVKFLQPGGEAGAPLQGQWVFYFGPNPSEFLRVFGAFGRGGRYER